MKNNHSRCLFHGILGIFLFISSPLARAHIGSLKSYAGDKRSAQQVRTRAQKEQPDDILVLGYRNDKASIPLLQHLADTPIPTQAEIDKISQKKKAPPNASKGYLGAEKNNDDMWRKIVTQSRLRSSPAAKMALTRMGAHSYFDEFVAGLSTTSYVWKTTCIEALGYINDKRAVKYLGALLEQDSPPEAPPGWADDVALIPYSVTAAEALSNLLPDEEDAEFKNTVKRDLLNRQETLRPEQWRQWWERNKKKYR